MSIDDDIRAAWVARQGFGAGYPRMLGGVPTAYADGYRDGRIAGMRAVLASLDSLVESLDDEGVFRAARDRLRSLL